LLVQFGELFKDHVEQEPLRQSESAHSCQGHIVELGPLAAKHIVVSDNCNALLFDCDHVAVFYHVIWVLQVVFPLFLVFCNVVFWRYKQIECNSPLALHNKLNLSHITFFFYDVPVPRGRKELPRDETKTDFVNKGILKVIADIEK